MELDGQTHKSVGGSSPLHTAKLLELLYAALPAGTVRWGERVVGYETTSTGLAIRTATGSTFNAHVLVGADGSSGHLRTAFSPKPVAPETVQQSSSLPPDASLFHSNQRGVWGLSGVVPSCDHPGACDGQAVVMGRGVSLLLRLRCVDGQLKARKRRSSLRTSDSDSLVGSGASGASGSQPSAGLRQRAGPDAAGAAPEVQGSDSVRTVLSFVVGLQADMGPKLGDTPLSVETLKVRRGAATWAHLYVMCAWAWLVVPGASHFSDESGQLGHKVHFLAGSVPR